MKALVVLAAALAACRPAGHDTLDVHGAPRHYELFVPSREPNLPLVIVLHGQGGTGRQIQRETRFDDVARRAHFIVVYPDAIDHHWNDGRPELANGVDDVAFIAQLIDELYARYAIDRDRVYVTGISNGGMMSYRLGCDLAGKVAAIAPVAGDVPAAIACHPSAPISLLAINGTADPLVPYAGGQIARGRGRVLSADASLATFAGQDGCRVDRAWRELPDLDPDDDTRSQLTAYTACPGGVSVELVTIGNGGHTWPGGTQYLPRALIGPVARDFDGASLIWDFFSAHPRTPAGMQAIAP